MFIGIFLVHLLPFCLLFKKDKQLFLKVSICLNRSALIYFTTILQYLVAITMVTGFSSPIIDTHAGSMIIRHGFDAQIARQ